MYLCNYCPDQEIEHDIKNPLSGVFPAPLHPSQATKLHPDWEQHGLLFLVLSLVQMEVYIHWGSSFLF